MLMGPYSAYLAYLVKGRHLRTRGRQTLQMNGFPLQTYGEYR